jgi:hypothetical protein
MKYVTFILIFGFFLSCSKLEPVDVEAYYDVDSLLNAQYEILSTSGAKIRKYSTVNQHTDTTVITPDSAQWMSELNVFKKANINKPLLRGAYEVTRNTEDKGEIIIYNARKPEDVYVKWLKIYKNSQMKLRKFEALVAEENPAYGSQRKLNVWFSIHNNQEVISKYEITGKQKMILKDTVSLDLVSEILYEKK